MSKKLKKVFYFGKKYSKLGIEFKIINGKEN